MSLKAHASFFNDSLEVSLRNYLLDQNEKDLNYSNKVLQGSTSFSTQIFEEMALPGKRVRPAIVYACFESFTGQPYNDLSSACAMAVEMCHTSSLILDDLPCMDDADLRRGTQTLHQRIGEGKAILVATSLIFDAFSVIKIACDKNKEKIQLKTLASELSFSLSTSLGSKGVCFGQWADLDSSPRDKEADITLKNELKTGCLFAACFQIGLLAGYALRPNCNYHNLIRIQELGNRLGRVFGKIFQAVDDMTDSDPKNMKSLSKDISRNRGAYQARYINSFRDEIIPNFRELDELVHQGLANFDVKPLLKLFSELESSLRARL